MIEGERIPVFDRRDVVLGEERIGTLVRTRAGARFSYADEVVEGRLGEHLLSLSLPVKARP